MASIVGFLVGGLTLMMIVIGIVAIVRWWYTPQLGSLSADPEVVARGAAETVLMLAAVWEFSGGGALALVLMALWCLWRGLSWPRIPVSEQQL